MTLFIRQKKIVRELPRTSPVDYIRIKVFQSTMTPKLKLYYFNSKGKGEPIRLFCAYAGLDLEDHRFAARSELYELRANGKLSFGQVPLLEVDGKHQLVQSAAIMRYLGKIAGNYPEDPLLAAKVDAALDQEADAFTSATIATYNARFGFEIDDAYRAKLYENISNDVLPHHLKSIEKLLQESSSGWLAGTEEPSIADFVWYSRLADYIPEKKELSQEVKDLEGFPGCKAFIEKFKGLDAIKKYYAASN